MNSRFIRSKMMNLQLDISVLESDLVETPWWRLLRNRKLRRSIFVLEDKIKMYEFDYEQLMDAEMSYQQERMWADPS